jgi:inorganic pyrophosphatase/exopolyphosphatase
MDIKIIAAGDRYTDIDVLACSMALNELKNEFSKYNIVNNQLARISIPTGFNQTIPPSIRSWDLYPVNNPFRNEIKGEYIIVDVSDPEHISKDVDQQKIVEIYDHHFGYDDYWRKKLGNESHIEPVGACATLIAEEIQKHANGIAKLTGTSVNLLYTAIISNTLNLSAQITKDRDRVMLNSLQRYITLPGNWIEQYYSETGSQILNDPLTALAGDTKSFRTNGINIYIGQLELWDGMHFIKNHLHKVYSFFKDHEYWFLTIPSISEGLNYFISDNKKVKELLSNKIQVEFKGDIGISKLIWLRKEIKRELNK